MCSGPRRWPAGPLGARGGEGEAVSEVPFPVDGRGDADLGVPRMTREECLGGLYNDSQGSLGRFAKMVISSTTRTDGAGLRPGTRVNTHARVRLHLEMK